jgi:transposase
MNGETFKAYLEQFFAPTLKRGDIVFTDNVSVHQVDGVEETIEACGAIPFYLPVCGHDFNPIEQLFAKLKALRRKTVAYSLKGAAFTVKSLCKAITSCLANVSRSECAPFLANSGYGQSNREPL